MKRTARILAVVAAATVGLTLLVAPVGAADSTRIVDDGWWWRIQTGIGGQPLPPPPNVGEDQLLVQAGPDGATAIAAVSAVLPDGHANPVLTLGVADDQGGATAVLLACRAGSAWTGIHAGNWEAAPVADCESPVEGVRSEDGTSWSFFLTTLQFNDKVNIVLVPGTNEAGAVTPFSLVFDAPEAKSITTTEGATAPPSTQTTGGDTSNAPPVQDFIPPGPPSDDFDPAPADPAGGPQPDLPPEPALDADEQGQTLTAPEVNEATLPSLPDLDEETSRTAARTGGILVLLAALAGGAVLLRGDKLPLLVSATASEAQPVEGGLGRFRRDRTAEPTPVS